MLLPGHGRDTTGAVRLDSEPATGSAHPTATGQLRCHGVPPSDREHALHLGQRGRIAVRPSLGLGGRPGPGLAHEATDGTPCQRAARRGHRPRRRIGQRLPGRASSNTTSSRTTAACRANRGTGSRPATAVHSGSSSWRTRFRVKAGSAFDVSHRHESESRTEVVCLVASNRQHRMPDSGRHAGRPVGAGSPQQVQQHGLGLVVHGVARGEVRRQQRRCVLPWPGPRGWDLVRPERPGLEACTETRRRRGDHIGLLRRPWSQRMVDVDRGDLAPRRGGEHQERQRVGTARDRTGQSGTARWKGAAAQQVGDSGGAFALTHRPPGPPSDRVPGSLRGWAAT